MKFFNLQYLQNILIEITFKIQKILNFENCKKLER